MAATARSPRSRQQPARRGQRVDAFGVQVVVTIFLGAISVRARSEVRSEGIGLQGKLGTFLLEGALMAMPVAVPVEWELESCLGRLPMGSLGLF